MGSNGKISEDAHNPLKALAEETLILEHIRNAVDAAIIDLLAEEPKSRYRRTASLMDLGLDSIQLTELSTRLSRELSIELPSTFFFQYGTADLAIDYLKENKAVHFQHDRSQSDEGGHDNLLKNEIKLQGKIDQSEPIAIIGMACRFPGANNYQEFWDNLVNEIESIQEIPSDRWDWKAIYGDPKTELGKTDVKWGGFIEDIDQFDPLFFNISPKEATYMDPQHRLFLQTVWHAMEDAGYSSEMIAGQKIGVYAGVSKNDYAELMRENSVDITPYISTGTVHSILTNRVSYLLDLHGPSESIDTACSSSFVALHSAIRDLRNGECQMAFVGGVNAILSPTMYISHTRSGMLSEDGHCKTFDESANGYVRGEGVGVLLIKSLREAIKDGDVIHALIRGAAINHGGKSSGLTAPNVASQTDVVQSALKDATIEPEMVTCIEVHGTGTPLGDPIEIDGLKKAFAGLHQPINCTLGAVKTNIGHLESASGIAGIIKMVLQLKNHMIPQILHFKTLNPRIHLEGSPFSIATARQEWNPVHNNRPIPRCGGVSSFGMGGSNGHVILQESPNKERECLSTIPARLFPLSANKGRLLAYVEALRDYFDWSIEKEKTLDLEAIAYTLQTGRNEFEERVIFLASSVQELREQINAFLSGQREEGKGLFYNLITKNKESLLLENFGEPNEVSRHWVNGGRVNWGLSWRTKPTRWAGLPGYPFQPLSCWFEGNEKKQPIITLSKTEEIFEGISIEIGIRSDRFFLKDHIVAGQSILPGVMYLEIARGIAEKTQTGRMVSAIRNVNWVSPIEALDVLIHLTVQLKGEELTHLKIFEGGALRFSGELVYESKTKVPERIDIAKIYQECPHKKEAKEIYEKMEGLGLKQGPSLRVLTELCSGTKSALGKLKLNSNESLKQYYLHPSLMDGVFQTVVAHHYSEHKDGEQQYLPFALESVEWFRTMEKEVYAYVEELKDSAENLLKYRMKMLNLRGEVLVQFEGFTRRPIRQIVKPISEEIFKSDIYYVDRWKEEQGIKNRTISKHLLLFSENDALNEVLPGELLHQTIISIESGSHFEKYSDDLYIIDPSNFNDFMSLMSDLKERGLVINEIIYAWETCDLIPILHLTQSLMKSRCYDELLLLYVYATPLKLAHAQYAMAAGFARTLIFENPKMELRSVEINTTGSAEMASIIVAELNTTLSGPLLEVSYTEGLRKVREVVPSLEIEHYIAKEPAFRNEGTYLITGGAGGLGQLIAKYLADTYEANLILVGRSKMNGSIQKIIEDLLRSATSVHYLSVDVTNADSLQTAFLRLPLEIQNINGVIHAAGIKKDSYILKKDEASFNQVISTKVKGALSLDALTKDMKLDFMVLFSSIAALIPNQGQSDYAAANSFLDYFSRMRNKMRDGITLAINWPLWASGGMQVTPEQKDHLKNVFGMHPLPTQTGIKAFEHLMSYASKHKIDQAIVIAGDKPQIMAAFGAASVKVDSNKPEYTLIDSIQEESGYVMATKQFTSNLPSVNGFSILGNAAVPGACFLEMAKQAAQSYYGLNYVTVFNNFWPYPLVLEHGKALVQAKLIPTAEYLNFEISTRVEGNKEIVHATGSLATNQRRPKPQQFNLKEKMNMAKSVIETDAFYDTIHQNADLRLTGAYRPVKKLYVLDHEAIGLLKLSNDIPKDAYGIHPILFTGLSQCVLVFTALTHRHFHPAAIRLMPVSIESLDLYAPFPEKCYIYLSAKRNPSASNKVQQYDVTIYDEEGEVVAFVSGSSMKISLLEPKQETKMSSSAEQLDNAENYAKKLVSRVLGIPEEEINITTDFEEYGVNSQMIVELNSLMEKELGPILKTLFFEYTTIQELAAYLTKHYKEKFAPFTPPTQPQLEKKKLAREPSEADIAIIGMSGRFPDADNLEDFWNNLVEGKDSISLNPLHQDLYHSDLLKENILSCKWGGSIKNAENFDPEFFGIAPKEAVLIDPQERLFLQVAWEALQDAGLNPKEMTHEQRRIGVFAGVIWQDYQLIATEEFLKDCPVVVSSLLYSIANRVSYTFNFTGPSFSVDSACSSSLTALHLACQSLIMGESRSAIVGGVNLNLHPMKYAFLNNYNFLSSEGKCRSYGEGGDGYVPGEGVGVLVLKPLKEAINDGDVVYAVIKSSSINHGGKTLGFTVPNPVLQSEVILSAIKKAKIDPREISYVEGHGTGTSLGDPVEVRGLELAYSEYTQDKQYCALGSVKSNIGHLEAAAGVASIIKVALQMQHKMLVPSLHSEILNKNIDFQNSPFYVQRNLEPWQSDRPLLAAVSSFGAGGSYAHVIIEEGTASGEFTKKIPLSSSKHEQKYWIENKGHLHKSKSFEHPLLGEKYSNPNGHLFFLGELNLSTLSYLKDHQVYSFLIYPAAGYLEMMLGAGIQGLGQSGVSLTNMSFESPLSLHEEKSTPTQVFLTPEGEECNVAIYSQKNSSWIFHAKGTLIPIGAKKETSLMDIEALKARFSANLTKNDFYSYVHSTGLNLGNYFETVEAVYIGKGEILGEVRLATPSRGYLAHPALLDGCFQVLYASLWRDKESSLYLPIGIDDIELFAPLGDHVFSHLQETEVTNVGRSADITIYSPAGKLLLIIKGLHLRKTNEYALKKILANESAISEWCYEESWEEHTSDEMSFPEPLGHWLILCNDNKVADAIVKQIENKNGSFRIVSKADQYKTRESLAALLQEEPISGIILVVGTADPLPLTKDSIAEAQVTGTEKFLHLIQALITLKNVLKIPAVLITSHEPAYSPLMGLYKTVLIEQPELKIKFIKLGYNWEAKPLLQIIFGQGSEALLSIEDNKIFTPQFRRLKIIESQSSEIIRSDATYLVTGGLGGLGSALVKWLVEKKAGHIVLTGRKTIDNSVLTLFDNNETKITYEIVDVSNEKAVADLINRLKQSNKPLKGIFHLAGILDDATLMEQTEDRFKKVFASKVYGSFNLHHYAKDLDLFVLFSSIASSLGNPGQSNYAAANAFMDSLCEYRKKQGLSALSVSWGPWAEIGMAKDFSLRLAHEGLLSIDPKEGIRALEIALNFQKAHITIANINWERYIKQWIIPPTWLKTFEGKKEGVVNLTAELEKTPPEEQLQLVKSYLCTILCDVLGLTKILAIDEKKGFFDMGLDSLMALKIRNLLQISIGKAIASTVVFDYSNLNKLTAYIAEILGIKKEKDKKIEKTELEIIAEEKEKAELEIRNMNENDFLKELFEIGDDHG